MGLVIPIFIAVFTVLVMLGACVFLVMEAQDRLESLRAKVPWLTRIVEKRESFNVLFVVCIFMLIGNGYELLTKEMPETTAPPIVKILPPLAPIVTSSPRSEEARPALRVPAQPKPEAAHLQVTQQSLTSTNDMRYMYRVVVQTTLALPDFEGLEIRCDNPISAAVWVSSQENRVSIPFSRNIMRFSFSAVAEVSGKHVFDPADPLKFEIWATQPVQCKNDGSKILVEVYDAHGKVIGTVSKRENIKCLPHGFGEHVCEGGLA